MRDALAFAVMVGLLAGCGADDAGDPPVATAEQTSDASAYQVRPQDAAGEQEPAAEVIIEIADFTYDVPAAVPSGAEVTVVNTDAVGHTVTSDDELFDVAVAPSESVTFTAPEEPGDYGFFCIPHPHMTATLVVE